MKYGMGGRESKYLVREGCKKKSRILIGNKN